MGRVAQKVRTALTQVKADAQDDSHNLMTKHGVCAWVRACMHVVCRVTGTASNSALDAMAFTLLTLPAAAKKVTDRV